LAKKNREHKCVAENVGFSESKVNKFSIVRFNFQIPDAFASPNALI